MMFSMRQYHESLSHGAQRASAAVLRTSTIAPARTSGP
jgi:hypothetical protein